MPLGLAALLQEARDWVRRVRRADRYGAVHTYTLGFAALEASRARQAPGSEDVSGLARQLAAYTTTGQFTEGLRYLLEGISGHAGIRQGTGRTTSRAPGRRNGPGSAAES